MSAGEKDTVSVVSFSTVSTVDGRPRTVLEFRDVHRPALIAASLGTCFHGIVYVGLFALRNREKKRQTCAGCLLLSGSVSLLVSVVVCATHTVLYVRQLKMCQTRLFTFLSWNMVLVLFCLDYFSSLLPAAIPMLRRHRKHDRNTAGATARLPCTESVVGTIVNICLLWWVFAVAYLEGLRSGYWKLNF